MLNIVILIALMFDTPPTADQRAAIDAKINLLGHTRYAVREQAANELFAYGALAKGQLRERFHSNDLEVAARAQSVLTRIINAEMKFLEPFPEMDAFWFDTKTKAYQSEHAPADMMSCISNGYTDERPYGIYYRATETWARKWLNAGVSKRYLVYLFADMHRRDGVFLARSMRDWGKQPPPMPVDPVAYLKNHQ